MSLETAAMAHTTDRSRRFSAGILGLARRGPFATVLNGELQFRSHYNARNEFSYLNAQQARPRNNHATNDRLLRQKLELSQERMGRLAGVSMRTVARWENGDVEPEPYSRSGSQGSRPWFARWRASAIQLTSLDGSKRLIPGSTISRQSISSAPRTQRRSCSNPSSNGGRAKSPS